MTKYEVYNTTTGNVISKPCPREIAEAIVTVFNDDPDGYTYAIREWQPAS